MERIIRIFTKESGSINQAALLLGSFTLFSQILALFRDRSIAHFIGPSPSLDAYYAAFRVPDLIFISIASLASITVLIPFLVAKIPARQLAGGDGEKVNDKMHKYLDDVFTVFFFLMVIVATIAFFLMPYLVHFIAPGFTSFYQAKVILLSRIMLLSPILLGLSNLFGTVTQLFKKEAMAIMAIRAILLKAKPNVRGSEISAVCLISLKLIEKENFGVKPQLRDARACIPKCIRAPNATPIANP